MHLVIDIGNTAVKAAMFDETTGTDGLAARAPKAQTRIAPNDIAALKAFAADYAVSDCIVGATGKVETPMRTALEALAEGTVCYLGHTTPIPIENCYATPATLGPDRLAAAVAAHFLSRQRNHGEPAPALVVDAGTAITYDFVSADGKYLGGNISPGMSMRFRALHEFTARLPLVGPGEEKPAKGIAMGTTTETAIRNGVLVGIHNEIEGYIREFVLKYPNLLIFFTGGNLFDFEETLKSRIFAEKLLVLQGLDIILRHIKTLK